LKKIYILLLAVCITNFASAQSFSQVVSVFVPDAGPIVSIPITASGLPATINNSFGVEKVNFSMTHTYTADIACWLKAPDGTTILLFSGVGGGGDNFVNTTLKWDAATSIANGTAPFTGSYQPMGLMGLINNGQNPNGIWQFQFQDQAGVDTGRVSFISITFSSNPAPGLALDSTRLPIVNINTGGTAIPDANKIPATFSIIDNGSGMWNYFNQTTFSLEGNMMVELQGFTGPSYPKKNYDFDLTDTGGIDIDTPLLGMPSENDWILKAEYLDYSLMKNPVSYEMSRRMGRYAPRTVFCEVLVNGEYMGVYNLTEKVKRDSNRVDISKLTSADISGPELTGGYIIEMNINGDPGAWNSTYLPINYATCNLPVEFKHVYPKADSINLPQHYYIKSFVDSFENALWYPGFQDPVTGWRRFAGEGSFIDFLIVNEFSANYDSYGRSTYLYKEKITDGNKLHIGPPWDYDRSFADGTQSGWVNEITHPGWPFPFWWSQFRQDSVFERKLYCRWHTLRTTTLSDDSFYTYIDSISNYIHDAAERNFMRWPELGVTDYDAQVVTLKDFIHDRNQWIDTALPDSDLVSTAVNLPNIQICQFETVNATQGGSWMFNYLWSTGATTGSIPINSSGSYSVTVSSSYGCPTASDGFNATTFPIPDASFTATSLGNNAYLFTPSFTTASLYLWDFGNGNVSSQMNPIAVLPDSPAIVSLTVYGANGCSDIFYDTLNIVNSVNGIYSDNTIHIYPNPASDVLFIQTDKLDFDRIDIMNVEARKVISEPFSNSISIQSLSQGVYELNFYSRDGFLIGKKRFVKI